MRSCVYAFLEYDKCLKKYKNERDKCDWLYHYLKACHNYKI